MAQLLSGAKIDPSLVNRVVFDGGAATVTAVAGGNVEFAIQSVSETWSLIEAGKIRGLAVTSPQRAKQLPNVPTSKEAGVPWLTWTGYTALGGPTNVPADIVKKWNEAMKEAMADPAFLKALDTAGAAPMYIDAAEFKSYLKTSYDETVQYLKLLGITK